MVRNFEVGRLSLRPFGRIADRLPPFVCLVYMLQVGSEESLYVPNFQPEHNAKLIRALFNWP
jgi:hypothetical protein